MKKNTILFLISCITILCFGMISCIPQQTKPISLVVSSANSYKKVMTEIDMLYKQKKPKVAITYNFETSQIIKQQIEQGAPVDIFISSNTKIMDDLQAQGFLIGDTRVNLARNQLVIIVPKDSNISISNLQDLTSDRVNKVAFASEKLAVGKYTKESLTSLKIYEQVKNKGVLTDDSNRQILKAVKTKQVDAGITYTSEAKQSNQVKVVAIVPENLHTPIVYSVAVIKRCQHIPEAKEFIQFLKSDRTTPIFEKYGFTQIK